MSAIQHEQTVNKATKKLSFSDLSSIKKIQESLQCEYKYFNSFDEFRDMFNAIESSDFKAKYAAEFKRVYELLYRLFHKYVLMPNTICVFDVVFRRFLKQQFEQVFKQRVNCNSSSPGW